MGHVVQFTNNNEVYREGRIIFVKNSGLHWEILESSQFTITIKRLDNGDVNKISRKDADYFLLCGQIEVYDK